MRCKRSALETNGGDPAAAATAPVQCGAGPADGSAPAADAAAPGIAGPPALGAAAAADAKPAGTSAAHENGTANGAALLPMEEDEETDVD